MITRSKALEILKVRYSLSNDTPQKDQLAFDAEKKLYALESAGMEFPPEEQGPNAVENARKEYERAVEEQRENDGGDHYPAIVAKADQLHNELQAEIERLKETNEGYSGIVHDMIKKDAEIERLRNQVGDLQGQINVMLYR